DMLYGGSGLAEVRGGGRLDDDIEREDALGRVGAGAAAVVLDLEAKIGVILAGLALDRRIFQTAGLNIRDRNGLTLRDRVIVGAVVEREGAEARQRRNDDRL